MSRFAAEDFFLVTGASSGIGQAIALKLNERGATVLANGRNTERLEQTRCMAATPQRMILLPRDLVEDLEALPGWLLEARKKYGALRGMVSCAGITWNAPATFYALPRVRSLFNICCHAPLVLGAAFCDRRVNAGPGSAIVHIAAAAAVEPNPGQAVYAGAKAALVAASKCLAREVASKGIRVNCVSPGLVKSPMMEATAMQLGPEFLAREEHRYPLGFGKPEYVAYLVLFLLSNEAAWITGQNFLISGGR